MRAARFGGYGIVKGELKKLVMLSTREMTLGNNDIEQTRTFYDLMLNTKHDLVVMELREGSRKTLDMLSLSTLEMTLRNDDMEQTWTFPESMLNTN